MEQHIDLARTKVPKRRGIAWNAFADAVVIAVRDTLFANTFATLTDPKAKAITTGKIVVMTGTAGDISVT